MSYIQSLSKNCHPNIQKVKLCRSDKKPSCNNEIPITAKKINEFGGYLINTPGIYCLAEDVNYSALAAGASAITVGSNNVIILLKNHTLKQVNGTTFNNNVGITVLDSVREVQIIGGTISDFSGAAILIRPGVDTITIKNLIIRRTGFNGAFPDLETPRRFSRPFAGGIIALGTPTNIIRNVNVLDNDIADLNAQFPVVPPATLPAGGLNGVTLVWTQLSIVRGNTITRIRSNDVAAALFLGRADDTYVKDERWENLSGGRNTNGLDSMQNTGNLDKKNRRLYMEDIFISGIVTDPNSTAAGEALAVEPTAEDFVFRNISVTNVINIGTNSPATLRAVGFQLSFCNRGIIENCTVTNVQGNSKFGAPPVFPVGSTGFAIDQAAFIPNSFSSDIIIRNCKAINISDNNFASPSGRAEGFRLMRTIGVQIDNCYAENIQSGANAAAYSLRGAQNCSISNSQGLRSSAYLVLATTETDPSSFNRIENNTLQTYGVAGISDQDPASNNIYYKNTVIGTSLATNYQGLPAGTPIRTWIIGSAPSPVDNNGILDPLDNISIQQT